MSNAELIDYIYKNSNVAKKDASAAVAQIAKAIRLTLRRGGSVNFAGVGIFKVTRLNARMGTHPKTQLPISIPARKKANFQACVGLTDSIN